MKPRYTADDYNQAKPDRGDPAISTPLEQLLYAAMCFSAVLLSTLAVIALCMLTACGPSLPHHTGPVGQPPPPPSHPIGVVP